LEQIVSMRRRLTGIYPIVGYVFALFGPGPAATASDISQGQLFQSSDIFALRAGTDAQISPDARTVAYVQKAGDVMSDRFRSSIWLIDVASGVQSPFAGGTTDAYDPQWSPDGRRLAYVSIAADGPQLFVDDMTRTHRVQLTNGPDGPKTYAWSPDGRQVAYLRHVPAESPVYGVPPAKPVGAQWAPALKIVDRVTYRFDGEGYLAPGYDHIFVVSSEGGPSRQVTSGEVNDAPTVAWDPAGALTWSADGKAIIFSAIRSPDWQRRVLDTEVYAADLATGAVTALTHREGPDHDAKPSPDGRWIAYLGYDDHGETHRDTRLYLMQRDGSGSRVLSGQIDVSIEQAFWAPDSASLYVSYDKEGVRRVGRMRLDGKLTELVSGLGGSGFDQPYTMGEFSEAHDTIAFASASVDHPPEIAIYGGDRVRQLTHLSDDLFAQKRLAELRRFRVKAPDGLNIDGWLLTPPGYQDGRRVPLILLIHGGFDMSFGPVFSSDVQLFAAAGYAVLMPNPRGSTSYGEAFALKVNHNFPGDTYGDLMASVDAAISAGIADSANLFVTGGSAGGILTAWVVGKTERFKAAVAQKMVANLASGALVMDATLYSSTHDFSVPPWEDPMVYWNNSPLALVGHVRTPTMLIVGDEDYRTPLSESEQYYGALQVAGVPTVLIEVPGAGHVNLSSRPSQSAARVAAILSWFDRYRSDRTHSGFAH
jgi:dipeptidyl aminopeptidase/acylaminoacyl peptidase